jgi:DNA-binding protein H-NS
VTSDRFLRQTKLRDRFYLKIGVEYMNQELILKGEKARKAAYKLANLSETVKNKALKRVAEALVKKEQDILAANTIDVENAKVKGTSSALIDRLTLNKKRIEGNTRQDNYAMRCVFHKCGFVKEAHHRKAWTGQGGIPYDAIGYGITKEDWQNKKITPVDWNDFKY